MKENVFAEEAEVGAGFDGEIDPVEDGFLRVAEGGAAQAQQRGHEGDYSPGAFWGPLGLPLSSCSRWWRRS